MLDWYLANFFFVSISLVESIVGNLALEQFKTKSTNKQKCTLEDKLGGFLISRDTQNKVAKRRRRAGRVTVISKKKQHWWYQFQTLQPNKKRD